MTLEVPPPPEILPGIKTAELCFPRGGSVHDGYSGIRILDHSLKDIGVKPGDFLITKAVAKAKNGELSAVDTPDGMLVRFWHAGKSKVRLESANPNIPPRYYFRKDVESKWRVVRVCRRGDHSQCFDVPQSK